jgi:hypothetical protein
MRARALHRYEAALQQGEAEACHSIATLYFAGGPGVGRDLERAASWFRKAADHHRSPHAQCALGRRYLRGEGVGKVDWVQAAHWFELAAAQGHAEAMGQFGCLLLSAPAGHGLAGPPPTPQQQRDPQQSQLGAGGSGPSGADPAAAAALAGAAASSACGTSRGLAWLERGAALGDESSTAALRRARNALAALQLLETANPRGEHVPDNR